ncbi:hypothetical protein Peur_017643 [Populus x canadensis]
MDIYSLLSMVDTLERLGIDRHFQKEMKIILDETYRYLLEMGDFMFKSFEDLFVFPLAYGGTLFVFHLLTLLITIALISNSFGVDILNQFSEDRFLSSPGGYVKDSRAALELYRALHEDFLKLAVEDFNNCQSIQPRYLSCKQVGCRQRLDKLKFARQKEGYCHFSAAATLFAPKLSDARISWAKNGVLTTDVNYVLLRCRENPTCFPESPVKPVARNLS